MNMVKDGLASHERCTCGHCRCDHASGFQGCEVKRCACARYTWPGPGAKVPANHRARQHFPRTAEKAEGSVRAYLRARDAAPLADGWCDTCVELVELCRCGAA